MEIIAANAAAQGLDSFRVWQILECATCDEALRIIREADSKNGQAGNMQDIYEKTLDRLSKRIEFMMEQKVASNIDVGAIIFSRETGSLCETSKASQLLEAVKY